MTFTVSVGPERAFKIPAVNLFGLKAKVAELAKAAAKIGVEPPAVIEVGEYLQEADSRNKAEHEAADVKRFVYVLITGDAPRLNGWEFVAAIEHTPEGNFVTTLKGYENEALRTISPTCEHCGFKRSRKNTYIVRHEDGRTVHVGRTCLKDFLGHGSPTRIADFAELIWSLIDGAEDFESESWGGGGGEWTFPVIDVVAQAEACVRAFGWTPASGYGETTAQLTRLALTTRKQEEKIPASGADYEFAVAALAWLEEQSTAGGSDYIWNLRLAAAQEEVTLNRFGLLCSLPSTYSKAIEREIRYANEKAEQKPSTPQGAVGEKIERDVTLAAIRYIEGDYGTTHLYKFLDAEGNQYAWFASREQDIEQGDSCHLKGTVKAHTEYEGRAETRLLRCKITDRVVGEQGVEKARLVEEREAQRVAQIERLAREQAERKIEAGIDLLRELGKDEAEVEAYRAHHLAKLDAPESVSV